jgi:hypothetical protein
MKLTIVETVQKAVHEHNARMAGVVADILRDKYGYNYQRTYEWVKKHTDISPAAWETLMFECDTDQM